MLMLKKPLEETSSHIYRWLESLPGKKQNMKKTSIEQAYRLSFAQLYSNEDPRTFK